MLKINERNNNPMMSQESMMKKKLENMHLKERIDYGYRKVITMMLISGLLSVVIIGCLLYTSDAADE